MENWQESILKTSSAKKIIERDKMKGMLSHAYLIVHSDKVFLRDYLKLFANIIVKSENEQKNNRMFSLIEKEVFTDVIVYPKDKQAKIKVEDVEELILESYVKPLECEKKVFILSNCEDMNETSQNKLLKTLEEAPNNVHIILGATEDYSLLPTIKSRVKKLTIPLFSEYTLLRVFKNIVEDEVKLKIAIQTSDKTAGDVLSLYEDEKLQKLDELAFKIINEFKTSKEVHYFSTLVLEYKEDLLKLFNIMKIKYRRMLDSEMLMIRNNYNLNSVLNIIIKISESEKMLHFNTNAMMVVDSLLLGILEEKYKWQKL